MLTSLEAVTREVELHVAEGGWDQKARLFALVPTADLVAAEPALADALGLTPESGGLTPIDQELGADQELETVLSSISWPDGVVGCVAAVERVVLPPEADGDIPDDRLQAAAYAAQHPLRQELRMVAAVLRDGATACAFRFRSHDDPESVVTGPDLVPALLELLHTTFQQFEDSEETR